MAECDLPKVDMRVRFPSIALLFWKLLVFLTVFYEFYSIIKKVTEEQKKSIGFLFCGVMTEQNAFMKEWQKGISY